MKVLYQDPHRLEIEHRPLKWMIGLGALAGVFALGGISALIDGKYGTGLVVLAMTGLAVWIMLPRVVRTLRLQFDRAEASLVISFMTRSGEQSERLDLGRLIKADVDQRFEENNSTAEIQLMLVLGPDRPPERRVLTVFQPAAEEVLYIVQVINQWLAEGSELASASSRRDPASPVESSS